MKPHRINETLSLLDVGSYRQRPKNVRKGILHYLIVNGYIEITDISMPIRDKRVPGYKITRLKTRLYRLTKKGELYRQLTASNE